MDAQSYTIAWLVATILTGVVAGFYLGHALLLGSMFSWLAVDGRESRLWQTYSEFRLVHSALPYLAIIGLQQLSVVTVLAVAVWQRRNVLAVGCAAVSTLLVPAFHHASGFGALELGVVSGAIRVPGDLARFSAWNVPEHFFYALATGVAFAFLLRGRRLDAWPMGRGRDRRLALAG